MSTRPAQVQRNAAIRQARKYARFPVSAWTDARRDLPDDDIDVLCCNATAEQMWVGYHSAGQWIKTDTSGDIEMTHLVSHWMDLPEVPA